MLNQILFLCQCKILCHIHIWFGLFQIILCNSEWWGVVSSTSRQLLLPLLVLVWVNCICYRYVHIVGFNWLHSNWTLSQVGGGLYAAILLIRRLPLQCRAYTQALQPEKWVSLLFPGLRAGWAICGNFIRKFLLQRRAYMHTQALQQENWISPLFPGPRAAGIANDWCSSPCLSPLYHPCQIHETLAWIILTLMRVVQL